MKRCSTCRVSKDESEFYRNAAQPDGLQNLCKPCTMLSIKQSKKDNPERVRRNRIAYLKRHPEAVARKRAQNAEHRRATLFSDPKRSVPLARYYRDHPNAPCVYLIGVEPAGSGPVKIGHTCNLPHRIKMLQCGSPVRLVLVAELQCGSKAEATAMETKLRHGFASHRIHGEWYSPVDDVLQCLSKP